ncbi:MAG: flagellar basal body-associated FliL family protein [Proteobacteria bacterium]|nr:flagellar basal body-associated FliL family protein [Pseudomonadota bacterium]MBU1742616.1 flagellar basal body-associated FliL family protein [Pseudomonadota bacterium]
MADQETEAQVEATAAPPAKKKSKLPLIIILLVVLLALGGGVVVIYKMMSKPSDQSGAAARKKKKPSRGEALKLARHKFDMKPFIVNLADPGGRRYLKVALLLRFSQKDLTEEIKDRLGEFRSAIILLLSSKSFKDIATMRGKIKLRNELIDTINKRLQGAKVYTLYFTDFVVQ